MKFLASCGLDDTKTKDPNSQMAPLFQKGPIKENMKKSFAPYLWATLAISLFSWAALELVLLFSLQVGLNSHGILAGAVVGVTLGAMFAALDGFLGQAPKKIRAGAKYGAALGGLGGVLGFYLIDQIADRFQPFEISAVVENLVYAQRWTLLGIAIGAAIGAAERSNRVTVRNLIAGIVAGLAATLFNGVIGGLIDYPFLVRGISLIFFSFAFILAHIKLRSYKRQHWVLFLNGHHAGAEFELNQNLLFLGTQNNDDINLNSYENVNSTHAKLIKYEYGFSLVDNDPFCQTFVNYRNITEQPLKNGDLIRVGTALLQYRSLG